MQTHSRALWKPRVNPLSFLNTNSYGISGLDQEPVNLPNCWERSTVTCGSGKPSLCERSCEQGLAWFLDMGGDLMWVRTATIILLTCTCCPGWPRWGHTYGTLGCCHRNTPQKKQAKSHIFHHHLKEREGNLCKVLQGAGQWWWLHWHGPSPNSIGILGGSLLSEEQRGCQNNTGNSSHEKQGKATGKKTFTSDRRLHLISREHRELPLE